MAKAVGSYVAIKPNDGKMRKSASGLMVPTIKTDRWVEGTVFRVSNEYSEVSGVKEGDVILYDKNAGHDTPLIDGNKYRIITARDIAMVL